MSLTPNIVRANEECLAFFEALRRMGYLPRDIYVMVAVDGRDSQKRRAVFVTLKVTRAGEVNLLAWHFDTIEEATAFEAQWASAARSWNETMSEAERERIYEKSFVRLHCFDLVMLLEKKFGHVSQGAVASLQRWRA